MLLKQKKETIQKVSFYFIKVFFVITKEFQNSFFLNHLLYMPKKSLLFITLQSVNHNFINGKLFKLF